MSGLRQRERRLIAKLRNNFETFALGCKDNFRGVKKSRTIKLNMVVRVLSIVLDGFDE